MFGPIRGLLRLMMRHDGTSEAGEVMEEADMTCEAPSGYGKGHVTITAHPLDAQIIDAQRRLILRQQERIAELEAAYKALVRLHYPTALGAR